MQASAVIVCLLSGLSGGTIDVSGAGALNLNSTGNMGFSGTGTRTLTVAGSDTGDNFLAAVIADDASFNATAITKSGTGKWILTGNNTAEGTVTISGGTLQIGNAGTSGNIAGNVTNGGTLIFNRSDNSTYIGDISSTGTVTKTGAGTLIFTGTNSYSGITTVSSGTLQIGDASTTGSITSNITNNAALVFDRSDAYIYGGVISGSGSVTISGNGTLTLSNLIPIVVQLPFQAAL